MFSLSAFYTTEKKWFGSKFGVTIKLMYSVSWKITFTYRIHLRYSQSSKKDKGNFKIDCTSLLRKSSSIWESLKPFYQII